MKIITGDLIELAKQGKFDVIIHGCNCFCRMSSGIAPQIKMAFPAAWQADLNTSSGDRSKLGTYTVGVVQLGTGVLNVVNAYTQFSYGGDIRHVEYDALRRAFRLIANNFSGLRIGYPAIGAGLGGGNWEIISRIIDEEMEGQDHTFVKYDKSG